MKDEHFDVARTRKRAECGLNEEMSWLLLHPSMNTFEIKESNRVEAITQTQEFLFQCASAN